MGEFRKIYRKVNGNEVLKDYAHAHLLLYALFITAVEGLSRKSLEIVRLSVSNKLVKRLRRKYAPFIAAHKKSAAEIAALPHEHSNKVWVCWLQGMENAPEIVKKCYRSLLENLDDREIILLTDKNYKDWVTFPDYIQEKIDNGTMTRTHMTDLLRLELLEHYGGTWIDATVFCTGKNIPDYIWDSDLFIYQIMKPGRDGHCERTSTWFITACTNHPMIILTKELLYEYWKTANRLIDYFLIHIFIEFSIETYPEEWMKVVPVSSSLPHILLLRFSEKYNDDVWQAAKQITPFHKLSWKFNAEQMAEMERAGTFYDVVLKGYQGYEDTGSTLTKPV